MRPIKFRAWHVENKTMVNFDMEKVIKDQYQQAHLCALIAGTHTDGHLMQFTGLTDKNGVDIYEKMEIDGVYNVEFKDGSYVLIDISNGDTVLLYNYASSRNRNVKITKPYTGI